MGDLKSALKEAKMSIKDKDYEAAMIHCKEALKIDRKNYQALVMFGRVCLEQHRYIDSKKALLLATRMDSTNPIAWQGLSSLHEKNQSCFDKDEEISILSHLKDITTEDEKLDRIYRRLASVYQRYNCPSEAISVLEALAAISDVEARVRGVRKSIIEIITSVEEPSHELLKKLIENYECILTKESLGENEANYQAYLRLVYKSKQLKKLMEEAQAMSLIFPTAYPLEWIARSFVEYNHFGRNPDENCIIPDENIVAYVKKLLDLYPTSPWGNLAMGLIQWKNGQMESSKNHLRKGCNLLEANLSAWMAFLTVQTTCGDASGAEATCRKIISLLSSGKGLKLPNEFPSMSALERHLLLTRVDSLFEMGHVNYLHEAVALLDNIETKSLETRIMMVKALVQLKKVNDAQGEVEALKSEFGACLEVRKITAFVALSQGDYESPRLVYEDILKEDPRNAEAYFELGQISFKMKDYHKSLIYLLKAAKYNPNLSSAFLYIGHYYRLHDNMDKARKCYEKALNLNPKNEDAGSSLSDVYRMSGQDADNFALLLRVTSEGKNGWAWLRLGLHYMALKNFDEAVRALQRALEISPGDKVCHECLGDAYLARGSYTAALKVFTKATELHPEESLYPRCKIAHINHIVSEFLLSISQYEEVLSEEDLPVAVRIVALVGLAEVLLARARKSQQEQLLANTRADCLYAIRCLTKAACEEASNFTIWKLLGDACTLQAVQPPSLSEFVVPARLLDGAVPDMEQTRTIDLGEMLQLGARCYGVGIQMDSTHASLWHDLGVNIFLQGHSTLALWKEAKVSSVDRDVNTLVDKDLLNRSMAALKKSLSLESSSFNTWNSLGVLAFFMGDVALAQHSFIRSLQLHPTVDAWTHLGAMYLSRSDIHLAHEAFSQAQALDPVFVTAWVGQAMVATSVGHYEAFDLYRHTTLLGIHPESCLGFASKVLDIACSKQSQNEPKDIHQFIPNITDSLTYYAREKETDAIAQNMLGLALEMNELTESASQAFAKAVEMSKENEDLSQEMRDGIVSNYSRTLTALNKLPDAISCYSKLKEPDFYSQCGLALAQLKASQFDEAYQRYTEACEWYAPDDTQKSHVLVALAFLQYKFQNIEQVKSLLFQSSSIQGLLALTSLGLLKGDATLTDAALAEIEPYVDTKQYSHHVAFLKATQANLLQNHQEAKMMLSRAIHRHPYNSALWRSLSRHLLSIPVEPKDSIRIAEAANASASAARALTQAAGDSKDVFEDVVLSAVAHLKAASETAEVAKRKKKDVERERRKRLSLVEAQKAVLMCPSKPETWAVLIASMERKPKVKSLAKKWSKVANPLLRSWLEEVSRGL